MSAEAQAALEDVDEALAAATDPSDLASRLSSVYDASLLLDEPEASAVQTDIAVAQNSYEYWYDGSEIESLAEPIASEMDDCLDNQHENMQYELDGIVYVCHSGGWVATSFAPPRQGNVRFWRASFPTTRLCEINHESVFAADVGGAVSVLVAGFYTGMIFADPPAVMAAATISAASASTVQAFSNVFGYIRCIFALD